MAVMAESVPLEEPENRKMSKSVRYFKMKVLENHKAEGVDEVVKKRWKKGTYTVRDANTDKVIGTYNSGEKASKAMNKLMDTGKGGDHKQLQNAYKNVRTTVTFKGGKGR